MAHTLHVGNKTYCLRDYGHICPPARPHPLIERAERNDVRLWNRPVRYIWFPNKVIRF